MLFPTKTFGWEKVVPEQRKKKDDKTSLSPEQMVADLLKDLRYGTLEIVVHDGRIVQLERREKLRFDGGNRV